LKHNSTTVRAFEDTKPLLPLEIDAMSGALSCRNKLIAASACGNKRTTNQACFKTESIIAIWQKGEFRMKK
jgi:hypothetical protein